MVGIEDGVTQEALPGAVEPGAFAIVCELARQDGLDVFWLLRNERPRRSSNVYLDQVRTLWRRIRPIDLCVFEQAIRGLSFTQLIQER